MPDKQRKPEDVCTGLIQVLKNRKTEVREALQMNGIHGIFGEQAQEKSSVQRSSTVPEKDAGFAAQIAREGGKTNISVSVSEGAVGNVEEELCYGDVRKEKKEEQEAVPEEEKEKELGESAMKLTADDYDALAKEGIAAEDLTADELTRAIERLRLGRELKLRQMEVRSERLVEEQREAVAIAKRVLKGNPASEYIAEKLVKMGLPVTESTVHKVYEAVEFSGSLSEMTESIQYYLVKFKKEPTIENVYMAQYSAGTVKATPVSDAVWERLTVSANQVLVRAGLPLNEENLSNARWLTEHGLPVNEENLLQMEQLNDVKKRTPEEVAELAAGALADGKPAIKASLTTLTRTEAEEWVNRISGFTPETVERAYVKKAADKAEEIQGSAGVPNRETLQLAMTATAGEDVTLGELAYAQELLSGEDILRPAEHEVSEHFSGDYMDFDINVVRSKRRLEEIRLKMTADSAFRLERQGIRLDTSGLSKMVDGLRAIESTYYRCCTEGTPIAGNKALETMFQKTMQSLNNLANSPSYTLGVTFEKRGEMTLEALSNAGTTLAGKLSRAGESYETLATRPQTSYGDTIDAAFAGNAELLKNMGLEASPENLRAVRILAYNSIELNEKNMEAVKDYDSRVMNLINGMHPAAALRLIREGINPLKETVDDLAARVEEIRREENLEGTSEKFARYLFRIERAGEITPEEKTAYIGMFRLFNQLEQTDGAAIGAVLHSKKELTLGNLLSAMRTAKLGGMDVSARDGMGGEQKRVVNPSRIDAQILSGIKIPGKLADISVNEGYRMYRENTERSAEETRQAVTSLQQTVNQAEQAPEFLKGLGLVVTANNVEAAKEFLSGSGEMYQTLGSLLKKYKTKDATESEEATLLAAGGVSDTESLFDVRVAGSYYRNLKKEVRDLEDVMMGGEPDRLDLKALKQIKMGVKLRGECAGKECFDFPVETKEGVRSMRVTLQTQAAEEEGGKASVRIPLVRLGMVQADLHIEDNQIFCYVSSDSREGTELLEHSKRELTERLLDLGVTDAFVYSGNGENRYGVDRIPGMDKEGDVTGPQEEKADTDLLLSASKAVFVHMMQLERA